jgi:hypothetical protein
MSKTTLFYLLQIFNFFIFLLGTFLLSSSLYLWITVQSFNSFVLSIFLISLFFLITSAFGYFCVWNSPYSIILYEIFLFMLTVLVIVLEFFLYFDEDSIISYMQSSMEVASPSLLNERNKLSIVGNIWYIKVGMVVSAFVIVGVILTLFIFIM